MAVETIEELKAQLAWYRDHNKITGARNSSLILQDAAAYIGKSVVFAVANLDDFTYFNDNYGHSFGDALLSSVGEEVRRLFGTRKVYSLGGDEFGILIVGGEAAATDLLLEWQKALRRGYDLLGRPASLTVSVGYVFGLVEDENSLLLMSGEAARQMFAAKREGKDRIVGAPYDKNGLDPDNENFMRTFRKEEQDPVTNLLNMSYFLKRAEEAMRRPDVYNNTPIMVFFNFENFKRYNDEYGFEAGDHFFREFAEQLQKAFNNHLASRFAEDHFYVGTFPPGLEDKIALLRDWTRQNRGITSIELRVGISDISSAGSIVAACDRAKVAADHIKGVFGSVMCWYDDELNDLLARKRYIVENIDKAIENEWIKVYPQPVVRALSEKVCGAEALARWLDPQYGFMNPGEFIGTLEESGLIHKLDLFVVRKITESYHRIWKEYGCVVPISFNLSRLDFELCDIFEEVEKIVTESEMPREMIHIEITESMLIGDQKQISSVIRKFHDAGYQVWMDDFGSGYSSLNVLKDYDFDEIKIDMKFLTSFNDKSKSILRSIVAMAKDLGIQTLAEGVETREQFEYLRDIGCEKIQGYLFCRPMPFPEGLGRFLRDPACVEKSAERAFYDSIGKVNFVSHQPIAVFEYQPQGLSIIHCNRAFEDALRELGTFSVQQCVKNLNDPSFPPSEKILATSNYLNRVGDEAEINFVDNGIYCNLQTRRIADRGEGYAALVKLNNLTDAATRDHNENMDSVLRSLYANFDNLYLCNYKEDYVESVFLSDATLNEQGKQQRRNYGIENSFNLFTSYLIYPEDRERFVKYSDTATLKERVAKAPNGILRGYFRTRTVKGDFIWKMHTTQVMQKSEGQILLCGTQDVMPGDPEFAMYVEQEMPRQETEDGTEPVITAEELWHNVVTGVDLPIFWKDDQRRFLGATRKFLDIFGLEGIQDILGKTDEGMGWHVNEEQFVQDELRVLRYGAPSMEEPGKIMIRGQLHNIVATKLPLYRDGKIVGLIGYFVDADEQNRKLEDMKSLAMHDSLTGLLNRRGIMDAADSFIEDYQIRHRNFGAVIIDLVEFTHFNDVFGHEAGDLALKAVAEKVRESVGLAGIAGRTGADKFMCLMHADTEEDIKNILERFRKNIDDIREIAGNRCTLYIHGGGALYSETRDMQKLVELARTRNEQVHKLHGLS